MLNVSCTFFVFETSIQVGNVLTRSTRVILVNASQIEIEVIFNGVLWK